MTDLPAALSLGLQWNIRITDVAIVVATLLGPILAVQAQKWLERNSEIKQRRISIFRALMMTRATALSPVHVEAINAIPMEFCGRSRKTKEINDAWKLYINHMGQAQMDPSIWTTKRSELFCDLLEKISAYLGYSFNRVELQNEVYMPNKHVEIETEQEIIRRGSASIFRGELALPLDVKHLPSDPEFLNKQMEVQEALLRLLTGQIKIPVTLEKGSDAAPTSPMPTPAPPPAAATPTAPARR